MNSQDLKRFVARTAMAQYEKLSLEERAALLEGLSLILEGREAIEAATAAAAITLAEKQQMQFRHLLGNGGKES